MRRQFSEAAERVLSLVSGYRNPLSRWLAMLQACIDDGGTRDAHGVFMLCALVAPVSAWINLAEEWQAELDQPPRTDYFKLQEAVRSGNLSTRPELAQFKINRFTSIVQRHVTRAVHVAMSTAAFNWALRPKFAELEANNPEELDGFSGPYHFLASAILRRFDYLFTDEVQVVFDEQGGEGILLRQWWPEIAKSFNATPRKHRVPVMPDYRSDQKFVPLQAANSFAWIQNREFGAPVIDGPVQPPTLRGFLGSIPNDGWLFDAATFQTMKDSVIRRLGETRNE